MKNNIFLLSLFIIILDFSIYAKTIKHIFYKNPWFIIPNELIINGVEYDRLSKQNQNFFIFNQGFGYYIMNYNISTGLTMYAKLHTHDIDGKYRKYNYSVNKYYISPFIIQYFPVKYRSILPYISFNTKVGYNSKFIQYDKEFYERLYNIVKRKDILYSKILFSASVNTGFKYKLSDKFILDTKILTIEYTNHFNDSDIFSYASYFNYVPHVSMIYLL